MNARLTNLEKNMKFLEDKAELCDKQNKERGQRVDKFLKEVGLNIGKNTVKAGDDDIGGKDTKGNKAAELKTWAEQVKSGAKARNATSVVNNVRGEKNKGSIEDKKKR